MGDQIKATRLLVRPGSAAYRRGMQTAAAPSRPFVPADLDPVRPFIRAVAATVIAARNLGDSAADVARRMWGRQTSNQVTLALLTRGATAPAMTSVAGWAQEVAASSVASFLASLQESAASRLIALAPRLDMDGVVSVRLPRATSTGAPAWTAEGAPAPVAQAVLAGPTLGPPRKAVIIETYTRELAESTPENVEALVGQILKDAVAAQLDVALFSNTAASSVRPPGLVAGITPLTASTAAGLAAALADVRGLVDAITANGGGADIAFACSAGRAIALRTYVPTIADRVFGSSHIAAGELYAASIGAFVSGFASDPEIRASIESVVHFEDTAPLAIGTPGSPATVAAPSKSAFQSDLVILRARLDAAWALRVPGAAAWINTGMTW